MEAHGETSCKCRTTSTYPYHFGRITESVVLGVCAQDCARCWGLYANESTNEMRTPFIIAVWWDTRWEDWNTHSSIFLSPLSSFLPSLHSATIVVASRCSLSFH